MKKIPTIIIKLHSFLNNLQPFWFIVVMTFLSLILIIPFIPIILLLEFCFGAMKGPNLKLTLEDIILGVVIIPPIETFLGQWLVIKSLRRIKKLRDQDFFIGFVSALVFGLWHTYSVAYIFFGFLVGVFLAYSFILYEHKKKSPFWTVTAIHSFRNFISIILSTFLDF